MLEDRSVGLSMEVSNMSKSLYQIQRIHQSEVTGYKVVAEIAGRLYSLHTGMEISEGDVMSPIKPSILIGKHSESPAIKGNFYYDKAFVGYTSVYVCKSDTIPLIKAAKMNGLIPRVLRMTLTKQLCSGESVGSPIFLGKYVKYIEMETLPI